MKTAKNIFAALCLIAISTVNLQAWNEDTRDFAKAVNSQKVEPQNDKNTILCLDRLLSADTTNSDLYYGVYIAILENGNEDMAGMLTEYMKDYMILKPDMFIEGYSNLTAKGKKNFANLLANRITDTSELDTETEAKAFFRYIENYLKEKTSLKLENLAQIEAAVLEVI